MNRAQTKILIAEDEENARQGLAALISQWGYAPMSAADGLDALQKYEESSPAVIIADYQMPRLDGLELLRRLVDDLHHKVEVIVLTGHGTEDLELEAIERGAFYYVEKPLERFQQVKLRTLVDRAVEGLRNRQVIELQTIELRDAGKLGKMVGHSKCMQEILGLIHIIAPSTASVLITGESGTGKELVARTLHELSPRHDKPFVAINCAAVPETLIESEIFGHEKGAFTGATERRVGCFELAQEGTLLLDEIAEMPIATQAKLLRVLEDNKIRPLGSKTERHVNVRVLAATNKEPDQAVRSGHLRQDLFYRLNVIRVHVPPLREHKEDLPDLIEHLIRQLNQKHNHQVRGVATDVADLFRSYNWPGNIREVRNVLERAVVVCKPGEGLITRNHLPPDFCRPQRPGAGDLEQLRFPPGTTVEQAERALIYQTLSTTNNNKTRAAELLGISLKTLHNKLKEYESQSQN